MRKLLNNFLLKRNQNYRLSPFHEASFREATFTRFEKDIYHLPKVQWTPNVSEITPQL